ncbi:MAG: hypothetical protein LBK83_14110 [Treponema sp.]|jgi:hypothetical protein|nr:hypothetical protein [Treponema sp.]
MSLDKISLDEFLLAFTETLTRVNRSLQQRAYNDATGASDLRIKGGAIRVNAVPVLKDETVDGKKITRIYLKLNGFEIKKILSFEVDL